MVKNIFNTVIILFLLCCWCGFAIGGESEYKNPHIFNYSFEKVWDTVTTAIQDAGWVIREVDKKNGFIAVNWQIIGGPVAEFFDRTLVGEACLYRYTYSIIPVDSNSTSVHVKCSVGLQNEFAMVESVDMISKEDIRRWEAEALESLELLLIGPPSVLLGIMVKYEKSLDRLRVIKVHPKSLAKKAGIRSSDIIIKINGSEVRNIKDHYRNMGKVKPGDTFAVTVSRDKELKEFTITVPADAIEPDSAVLHSAIL